jgi:hypothetical protein
MFCSHTPVIMTTSLSHEKVFKEYIMNEWMNCWLLDFNLRAFEQGGIFIVLHLQWHRASFFPVSTERPPHSATSYDTQGDVEDLFIFLTRILTVPHSVASYGTQGDTEDLFLPRFSRVYFNACAIYWRSKFVAIHPELASGGLIGQWSTRFLDDLGYLYGLYCKYTLYKNWLFNVPS